MSSFQDFGVFVHNNPESPEAILCYTPFRFLRVLLIKDQKKNNKKTMPNSPPPIMPSSLPPSIYCCSFISSANGGKVISVHLAPKLHIMER